MIYGIMMESYLDGKAYEKDAENGKLKEGHTALYVRGKLVYQSENPYEMINRTKEAISKEKSSDVSLIHMHSKKNIKSVYFKN